jgi:hypothetical protein
MARRATTGSMDGWLLGPEPGPGLGAPRPHGGRSAALVVAVLAILVVVAL